MRSPRRKRSLRREIIKDVDREVLIELARRVVYVGSPEHKDVISFFSPRSPSLVIDTNTERQKRNRAFAAEFLAPAEQIKRRLAGKETTREEMDEIAYTMGVSSYVVAHQVQNHGLAVFRDES